MTVSLKEVIGKIEAICLAHKQVNDCFYGQIGEVYHAKTIRHTAVIFDAMSAIPNQTDLLVTFTLSVVDKVLKDNANKIDVESETLLILGDIINIIETDNTWRYCGLVGRPNAVKIVEKQLDVVNGWVATMQLRLMKVNGLTDIPATSLPTPPSSLGTINVNGNLYDTINSGEILDVIVEYENGTPVGTITGTIVIIPNPSSCADVTYTIKDTAATVLYTGSIASGGDLQQIIQDTTSENSEGALPHTAVAQGVMLLPNIRINRSDNSLIESYPSAKNYVVDDTQINVYLDGNLKASTLVMASTNETINISL